MGHNRLGSLPNTKPWNRVVEHIAEGDDAPTVALATSNAAAKGLQAGSKDAGIARVIFLLARSFHAAKFNNFQQRLLEETLVVTPNPTLVEFTTAFAKALQTWHSLNPGCRTDLSEMATLAALETLTKRIGERTGELFATDNSLQRAMAECATLTGFAAFGHEFYGRFLRRFLLYHLSRELSHHIGGNQRFADQAEYSTFLEELAVHCGEASLIVRDFVGGWYHKSKFTTGLSFASARGFSQRCLEKLTKEILNRRTTGV